MDGAARRIGWLAMLVGAVLLLRAAAGDDLSTPPLTSFDALGDWADRRDPATTAIALVRFTAELAAWYLLGLTVLYASAAALRSGGLTSLADALAAPGAARLVRGGLGLGLLASTAAGAATQPDERATTSATATMRPLVEGTDAGTAWMVPQPSGEPSTPADASAASGPDVATVQRTTWAVNEGESFWSIAEDVLEERLGRHPSDAEIDPFWRAVVDANRHRLVDADDPDLIHPGQVFELPPP